MSISSLSPSVDTILEYTAHQEHLHMRLDVFLANQLPEYTRSFFKRLIEEGNVTMNGKKNTKSGTSLKTGDRIQIALPTLNTAVGKPLPETDLGVRVLFEHLDFFVVYKPAGLIVHSPTTSSTHITLVDWLLNHFNELTDVGAAQRPGIVHRLDKDTSGLLIIPRTPQAHALFSTLFKERTIRKVYRAIVQGHPPASGTIEFPVSRHPVFKHKMTHHLPRGRNAVTHYQVLEYFPHAALVEVYPVTGRTHQIRVHFAGSGYPLIGDSVYGKASSVIERQALHATMLSFFYKSVLYTIICDMPQDMKEASVHLAAEK